MRQESLFRMVTVLVLLCIPVQVATQEVIRPDLAGVAEEDGWRLVNRGASTLELSSGVGAMLDARSGSGVAWVEGLDFGYGTIDVSIRGKDVQGQSFVGIAFWGRDDETYDGIYFRPFNFYGEEQIRRDHSVQYISHPDYTWSVLRSEHPGVYESALASPPDPNDFFGARIVLEESEIRVYLEGEDVPALTVTPLSDRRSGQIGLWVGNGSDGAWADLVLTRR